MTVLNPGAWFTVCDPELEAIDLVQFILNGCHLAAQVAFPPACGAALSPFPVPDGAGFPFWHTLHRGTWERSKNWRTNQSIFPLCKVVLSKVEQGGVCNHWQTWGLTCLSVDTHPVSITALWLCRLGHWPLLPWSVPDVSASLTPHVPCSSSTFFYGRGWHRAKPESSGR